MSSWPAISALDAGTQTFTHLSPAQINRMRSNRKVQAGEIWFRPGDAGAPFVVLRSGRMEIVQLTYSGQRPITTHGRGAIRVADI